MTESMREDGRKRLGKSVLGLFAYGGIRSVGDVVSTSAKALGWLANVLVAPFKRVARHGFKGDPALRSRRIPRDEILRMYGMDEQEAQDWASALRRNQIVLIFMSVLTLVLGFWGGENLPGDARVLAVFAAILVLLSFVTIILRDEWRIEVLTGQRNEWMPFVGWVVMKFTGRG